MTPRTVLTIAGSDSGGGAGIQADLKTFAALGAYGTSVLTAVTAQNTRGVDGVLPLPPQTVTEQLDSVLTDFTVRAVKTGVLGTPAVADAIADAARSGRLPHLVVDPVLVATSGHTLGVTAAVERLLPYAQVATPNCAEAAALTGGLVTTVEEMVAAAEALAAGGPAHVVVTGGDVDADGESVDVLVGAGGTTLLRGPRVDTANNHGTGCSFSAAVAVRLAAGDPVAVAVATAKEYVARALTGGRDWKLGAGAGPLDHFGWACAPDQGSAGASRPA
ncbi:bifunctional hydroxymethylpyrimidine kinase/phosphomethylpyrimidine kinase [Micromonospora sp. NPDC000207]|uniref:bifunctional hydroxymethylpyrimidine kinase/phosphomethylpyrimidine kinase n=1 Tax=Micromonospora sp. NPDC000207 TaxID=3154246 RepID=UPI00332F0EFB